MSKIGEVKKTMEVERFNANKGGSAITYFLKRHPEIVEFLKSFMIKFPCFEKESEVLSWIQNKLKIKKCLNCGKRLTYTNSRKGGSVACSKECSKSEICRKHKNEKRIAAIVERCGENINPFQMDWVKEKIKQTNIRKYGVENPMQDKDIAKRSGEIRKEKYDISGRQLDAGYARFTDRLNFANLSFNGNRDSYVGVQNGTVYSLHCNACGKDFNYKYNSGKNITYACPFCHPSNRSIAETELANYVSNFVEIVINDRLVLSGNKNPELDILIPSKNIAIEYNGLYWHSEERGKNSNYHLDKTIACEEQGIRLVQIFEDEWIDKKRIVKNRLKSILGVCDKKIMARKCEVREVSNELSKKFLEKYHIQGNAMASVRLGLFHKNRLVALMTFAKPRFNKNYDWELVRYCTIGDWSIVGGAGKLLKEFQRNHEGSIISYADRRWSNGDLYRGLGFVELENSKPAYFYTKDGIRFSRVMFQKHKLKNLLENFDEKLSESQNMENNGFIKVYDCGNKVFALR